MTAVAPEARASSQIAGSVRETFTQSAAVSANAGQVSDNVQTVAAGPEQMTASIAEIAKCAEQAADVARRAVTAAANADAIPSTRSPGPPQSTADGVHRANDTISELATMAGEPRQLVGRFNYRTTAANASGG